MKHSSSGLVATNRNVVAELDLNFGIVSFYLMQIELDQKIIQRWGIYSMHGNCKLA